MTDRDDALKQNRRAWNALVTKKDRFTRPVKDEDLHDPLATIDGIGWLGGSLAGKDVLCLAAGGGKHSALYAQAGANVTVVDLSPAMLELDREVAAERGLAVRAVEASMDDLAAFDSASFDVVIHPVSTCYLPTIAATYAEVARVTRADGVYVSQHKQPTSLQTSQCPDGGAYRLETPYYTTDPLPNVVGSRLREEGTREFLHRWEELIGSLCRSGFWIEDLIEPLHARVDAAPGEFGHRCRYTAPYVRIKARRRSDVAAKPTARMLWLPD
jgi:SAM-dependent methyltransferase